MGNDALGLFAIIFIIGITFVAFRTAFFGMKLMAGMAWIVAALYWKANPPTGLTEGDAVHTGVMIVFIGIGLMIVLAGLGRGIQRTEKWNTGEFTEGEGFRFKLPPWLKLEDENSTEARRDRRRKAADEYEARLDRILNSNKRNKR